jgi:hypothetical protein
MKYRLKADHNVTCEAECIDDHLKRSCGNYGIVSSTPQGPDHASFPHRQIEMYPPSIFERMWEAVPEAAQKVPSIEEELDSLAKCKHTTVFDWAYLDSVLRQAAAEIRAMRIDRELDRQALSTMAVQINEARREIRRLRAGGG